MRAARIVALGLLLASSAASADLCDGPCSVTMDFANGGAITSDGATITFSTGGALVLGTGGSITLGTGGSLTPNQDPPDMSNGGALVLGAGGSVQFGAGGSLDSGAAGGIGLTETGDLAVTGAVSVVVDAAQSVHLGLLDTDGTATVTAGGSIDQGDTSSPIHLDTTSSITVTSDADVTLAAVTAGTVQLNPGDAGAGAGGGFSDCSDGCPSGGNSTIGSPTIPTESGFLTSPNPGGGAPSLPMLLGLAILGLLRRR